MTNKQYKLAYIKMVKLREKFNDKVREWGNNRTERFKRITGKGLGDLLTAEINFRRMGATAGALAPVAGLYYWLSEGGINPVLAGALAPTIYLFTIPVSGVVSAVLGGIGYKIGEKLDNLTN